MPPVEVRLDERLITVGRAEGSTLSLRDMNVSRHHFSLELRDKLGYVLQDQGSRNGTIVNGVSVLNKLMLDGDRIQVGGSTLTFKAKASPAAKPLSAMSAIPQPTSPATPVGGYPLDDVLPGLAARPTLRANKSDLDAAGRKPETRPSQVIRRQKQSDDRWRKLAEIACAINLERDVDALLEKILEAVLSLVPSKSAFLVLCEGDDLVVRASHNQPTTIDEKHESFRLSRQVCRDAIAKRCPVLTQDAVSDDNLSSFLTVMNLQLKSILCVPFASKDEVLGVVYLDEPESDPFQHDGAAVDLVAAFGDLAGIALANAQLLSEIAARERLQKELQIAAAMQRALLPKEPPKVSGLEIAGRTQSALAVGGDIYDFFNRVTPTQDTLISIGDVAGKGVGAGLVMAAVRSLLHAYAEVYTRTDKLLVHLNGVLCQDLDPGIFVSLLLIRYSAESAVLRYTGAGHEHLILYRPSTDQMEFLRAGGVVVGLVDDLSGRVQERELPLKPGDVVCLYTDGATEAFNADDEEFGLRRLAEAVKSGPLDPASIVERCMKAVQDFTGEGRDLSDDLTIVAIRKT
jgi:serine phosphatase RsbU (regulator of sigma subunit)